MNQSFLTATIIELLYKNPEEEGLEYTAEIYFASKESWEGDIETFLDELEASKEVISILMPINIHKSMNFLEIHTDVKILKQFVFHVIISLHVANLCGN